MLYFQTRYALLYVHVTGLSSFHNLVGFFLLYFKQIKYLLKRKQFHFFCV